MSFVSGVINHELRKKTHKASISYPPPETHLPQPSHDPHPSACLSRSKTVQSPHPHLVSQSYNSGPGHSSASRAVSQTDSLLSEQVQKAGHSGLGICLQKTWLRLYCDRCQWCCRCCCCWWFRCRCRLGKPLRRKEPGHWAKGF